MSVIYFRICKGSLFKNIIRMNSYLHVTVCVPRCSTKFTLVNRAIFKKREEKDATICISKTSKESDTWPVLSTAQPPGIGSPLRFCISTLPTATVVVAMSRKKLSVPNAGAATVIGFVPNIACHQNGAF